MTKPDVVWSSTQFDKIAHEIAHHKIFDCI